MTPLIEISVLKAVLGGGLIGLAAAILLAFNGRIAGVSGIAAGLIELERGDVAWRGLFILGLLVGGLILHVTLPDAFGEPRASTLGLLGAGFLVGVGTTLANGCTSGHGVCGLARRSPRSLVATVVFMGTAMITVFVAQVGG